MTSWDQEKMDLTDWQTVVALLSITLTGGALGAICTIWMVW